MNMVVICIFLSLIIWLFLTIDIRVSYYCESCLRASSHIQAISIFTCLHEVSHKPLIISVFVSFCFLFSFFSPLTVHCSPGTGRTGTIIACDIAIRSLEMPKRAVDIPQIVYYVRHGRASAVRTKEQYEFIYKVANMYATKITNPSNDN